MIVRDLPQTVRITLSPVLRDRYNDMDNLSLHTCHSPLLICEV
ncbi:hypothetical protein [Thermosynechococcus sichuanensis]|nr:hypothetical protein [Thermosynechococcus vestitus]